MTLLDNQPATLADTAPVNIKEKIELLKKHFSDNSEALSFLYEIEQAYVNEVEENIGLIQQIARL